MIARCRTTGFEQYLRKSRHTPCMGKLEALPWLDGFTFSGHGARVGVRVTDASLLPVLRDRLPPGSRIAKGGVVDRILSLWSPKAPARTGRRELFVLYADHVLAGRDRNLDTLLESYDSHARIAIAQYARPELFVHAGAVAWRGAGIVIATASLGGKSHLVSRLVRAGATYYSDEYAVFDRRGYLLPFAKPISLRACPAARQRDIAVEQLGGRAGTEPVPVALMLIGRYVATTTWQPRQISTGEAMLGILENCFSARERPGAALETLQRVAQNARVLAGDRGDADAITGDILKLAEEVART